MFMRKERVKIMSRDINLKIDGQLSPREVFFFDGTEEDGSTLVLGLYTFCPRALILSLKYDDEAEGTVLEYLKDYVIYEFDLNPAEKNSEKGYEILLRNNPKRPATLTVIRPFFGSLEHEKKFVEAQNLPEERAIKGAHKSLLKKKPLYKRVIDGITSSKIVDFIITFSLAVAVFVVAVNIFGIDPATATTLMMVIVAIWSFFTLKR